MAPFDLNAMNGTWLYYMIFLLIGMGFGAVLEMAGFGDSIKLTGQFYLRDMTVLKVMFTGIIVAMTLIFAATAFQILDFSKVWVNPTYLWPGIVGGLIMGVGFVVGGFCPGTSMVAASTLKVDGIFFVLGSLFGVFAFGETVPAFSDFWLSSNMGRFTIPEWLNLPYGVVVVLVVMMALAMFYGAEISEAFFGAKRRTGLLRIESRGKILAAAALLAFAAIVMVKGQPTVEDRWQWIASVANKQLADRAVFVDPREVVDLKKDLAVVVDVMDVRSEADFNRFHLSGARLTDPDMLKNNNYIKGLLASPDNAIHFIVANGEEPATEIWKNLRAQGVLNIYIIEGGINRWLEVFPLPACVAQPELSNKGQNDRLNYKFSFAVGERVESAHPEIDRRELLPPGCKPDSLSVGHGGSAAQEPAPAPAYIKKVKLQKKSAAKGGCG